MHRRIGNITFVGHEILHALLKRGVGESLTPVLAKKG